MKLENNEDTINIGNDAAWAAENIHKLMLANDSVSVSTIDAAASLRELSERLRRVEDEINKKPNKRRRRYKVVYGEIGIDGGSDSRLDEGI